MNRAILAPAGGRKTQTIVDACSQGDPALARLAITYTKQAQQILTSRLYQACTADSMPEVMGWYQFLLSHIVRPYISYKFDDIRVQGLHYIQGKDLWTRCAGAARYFDPEGSVFNTRIALLSEMIMDLSSGAVIDRLEGVYDEIYIDEVQDLGGNDLDILDRLLSSNIDITLVGDIRQSLLTTSRNDTKNRSMKGLSKITWFRERDQMGTLTLREETTTWRCPQDIINFADSVLPKDGCFPSTRSLAPRPPEGTHTGVWFVPRSLAHSYFRAYSPAVFRHSVRTKIPEDIVGVLNFGECKGMTMDHVMIYPTKPMKEFLTGRKSALLDSSAARFYVAISRARYSVAIVMDRPWRDDVRVWSPYVSG